jgi:methylase of polypeptide subunit release factors
MEYPGRYGGPISGMKKIPRGAGQIIICPHAKAAGAIRGNAGKPGNSAMGNAAEQERGLIAIGKFLKGEGYAFTTITPASHALVNGRKTSERREGGGAVEGSGTGRTLRDIFGWSRAFGPDAVPGRVLGWLGQAGELEHASGLLRSKVRYSTLKGSLYVHSAFPTEAADSVFFGPDTYRFADLIERAIAGRAVSPRMRVLDIGCGSGAGGLFLAGKLPSQGLRVFLSDINFRALHYARVNAALSASGDKEGGRGDAFAIMGDTSRPIKGPVDIIISNPPYLVDAEARLYRNGGGVSGCGLSLRIVRESIPLLAPGGMLILYTGTPVVEGRHVLQEALAPILAAAGFRHEYAEIDPDVFGEELSHAAYASADRLAAVSLVLHRQRDAYGEGPHSHAD